MHAVFELAGYAPWNSNTQPWQVEVVSGAVTERLADAVVAVPGSPRVPACVVRGAALRRAGHRTGQMIWSSKAYPVPRRLRRELRARSVETGQQVGIAGRPGVGDL
nr:hypothetical protein [Mycolicibacterium vaccae]